MAYEYSVPHGTKYNGTRAQELSTSTGRRAQNKAFCLECRAGRCQNCRGIVRQKWSTKQACECKHEAYIKQQEVLANMDPNL